jgi:signal transduction histidine kinase
MNLFSPSAFLTAALLACAAPLGAAMLGLWPGAQALLSLAVAALALCALLFHAMLVRRLGMVDALAAARQALEDERHTRLKAEQAVADAHDALCRLVRQQEQVREAERNRIARDIHDDLGQHLLALKIEVQLACQGAAGAPAATDLARLADNIDSTIASLRVVIDNLRPPVLEDGLQMAMEQHLREFSRLHGIGYQLVAAADHASSAWQRDLDVILLRILRESLANVVRHAQASEVRVALRRSDTSVTLEIRDNGIGIAGARAQGEALRAPAGFGLAGIADRVAAAGGSFAIDSGPGAGTVLSMSIPLPQG